MTDDTWSFKPEFRSNGRWTRIARGLFGDRVGLVLFLASVLLFAVYWIADWRINDSLTLYNGLHALADGSVSMTEPVYGGTLDTPGIVERNGKVYSRNYGVLVVSLLPLAIVRLMGILVDLRIAVAGLWVLGFLGATLLVGHGIDRSRSAALWGSAGGILLFAINVVGATDLDPSRGEMFALQFTHLVAAGFVVVFLYRLLSRLHGRRVGLFGGALLILGTPLGVWATIPKRHVITALALVLTAYCLYRSRETGVVDTGRDVRFRAVAYVSIGLLAWIHSAEALVTLFVLALVDLPTARRNNVRSLAVIGIAFAVSLIPFFVTNAVAFGSPFTPSRLAGGGTGLGVSDSGGASGSTTRSGSGGSGGTIPILTPILGALDPALDPISRLLSIFDDSIDKAINEPITLWEVFVRSGYLEDVWSMRQTDHEPVNLSLLESGPVIGAVAGVVGTSVRWAGSRSKSAISWQPSAARSVDLYVLGLSLGFVLLYLSRLPLNAQVTVRYLVPLFPALVYAVARLPAVHAVAREHARTFAWTVAAGVLVGGQLVVLALAVMGPGRGEAFQFHALVALVTAVPLGAWALLSRGEGWWGRVGAVLFGLAAAATTVFLLLLALDYWPTVGGPGLPIVRTLAEIVEIL